ncbi:MAG: nuclear transport factor 2 family protein [Solirubrobacteraceae bacterium]
MSTQTVTITGVVERMLDRAANGRWRALADVLDDQFEIVEPDSLPYGGTHHGLNGYRALMEQITTLFELAFDPPGLYALDETTVVVRMNVTFTARSTGRSVKLSVVEVLTVVRGRVRRSEVFLADTAALLATLADDPAAST